MDDVAGGGLELMETLTLRATVIARQRYNDDYTVIWRELSRHPVHGSAGDAEPHRVSHYA
jgi:hypothetical protein